MFGKDKGNEVCTERDCSLAELLGQGNKHYRYQCGSDHIEGYGNTEEREDWGSDGGGWGKVLGKLSGGWG